MPAMRALRGNAGALGNALRAPGDTSLPVASDWVTIEQAACALGVSSSTVRRRMGAGALPYRVIVHKGRRTYRVHLPGHHSHIAEGEAPAVVDLTARIRARERQRAADDPGARELAIQRLEQQVDHLSEALARALRTRARPPVGGAALADPTDPYRRYRELVRRRRWWPFS